MIRRALLLSVVLGGTSVADDAVDGRYRPDVRPLLEKYCVECHDGDTAEADVDLAAFESVASIREQPQVWQRVRGMLETGQMPPRDSRQPSEEEARQLRTWVRAFLQQEAEARAGDPGPVVLRRLSNDEYAYTIRDLTGVTGLDPTREFPVDGAAGEGFTNTGDALGMSPSLVTKYLDAAKEVAEHAVLLPDGIDFTAETTRRDRTDAWLNRIRAFYARRSVPMQSREIRLHGLVWDTADGGRLPLDRYLRATIEEREVLERGGDAFERVATERGLSAKYLGLLWTTLNARERSSVLDDIRGRWREAEASDVPALVGRIGLWQEAAWRFESVGHIGRQGGPTAWQVPVNPIVGKQDFEIELPDGGTTVRFDVTDAGDGNDGDIVVWRNARLVGNGPEISLRDVASLSQRLRTVRSEMLKRTPAYLAAADDRSSTDVEGTARMHGVDAALLAVWRELLGRGTRKPVEVTGHFEERLDRAGEHEFITGWGVARTPQVLANSSKKMVRVPGIVRGGGVVVHPSPTLYAAVTWQSPLTARVRIEATIADAHPECGNGVEWWIRHRFGSSASVLGHDDFERGGKSTFPARELDVRAGDVIELDVGPRNGEHTCDLTAVDLVVNEIGGAERTWNLARDVSPNLLAGNPHADSHGNDRVWHFTRGEVASLAVETERDRLEVPAGSLLARWLVETDPSKRAELAEAVAALAIGDAPEDSRTADAELYAVLQTFPVPLDHPLVREGLAPDARFGRQSDGGEVGANDLVVRAPETTTFEIPEQLARGRSLVVSAELDGTKGRAGSVRARVRVGDDAPAFSPSDSFIVGEDGRHRIEVAFDEFRRLFPAALCYTRIVPVDEVVTLTLYHREDEPLRRLVLEEDEVAELDRLWDELAYVARAPLQYEVAFEQISEFATQDRPDLVTAFATLEPGVRARAEAFRERLVSTEPTHLEGVLEFANRAWRRPLTDTERTRLVSLYDSLRERGREHEEATRLVLARVLTSPAFLYRLETPAAGPEQGPVSDLELATRLSYFLTSSLPDAELRAVAETGRLTNDDVLLALTRRLLGGDHTDRLALHFACQWLHVRNLETVEKNEERFPEFAGLRDDVRDETVRFFADMFRENGSILDLVDADHTYLNGPLARHYGIEGVDGPEWRRVDGLRDRGRGGVLGMASVLASQSGVSRTSPILRGNWVFETLLGERLPRPPANVPQLPESLPSGLTARQLIERHSADPACAKCHARIDPYGFALEGFDTTGRRRETLVDTTTTLPDGTTIDGLDGLRDYLLTKRRGDVVHQFCRKLLGYALGREVQLSDEPLLSEIERNLAANDFRVHVAVEAIVTSRQFREIRGRGHVDQSGR